jgi:hypothetical protein
VRENGQKKGAPQPGNSHKPLLQRTFFMINTTHRPQTTTQKHKKANISQISQTSSKIHMIYFGILT